LASLQVQGETVSKLFAINTVSGLTNQPLGGATLIGTIAGGEALTAMAIAPSNVQFIAPLVSINESLGKAWITLTRTGGSGSSESVLVSTFDGTAREVQDFTPLNNLVVTFAPGETRKSIQIQLVKDSRSEGSETVFLVLGTPVSNPALLGALATTTLRIMG
jgi:acid phosphatase family membrane protein YuiD